MDTDQPDDLRLALARKLCLPLLSKLSLSNAIETVQQHLKSLVDIVAPCVSQGDNAEGPVFVDRTTMVSRIGAFILVEVCIQITHVC